MSYNKIYLKWIINLKISLKVDLKVNGLIKINW